jgi:hypothetical protein
MGGCGAEEADSAGATQWPGRATAGGQEWAFTNGRLRVHDPVLCAHLALHGACRTVVGACSNFGQKSFTIGLQQVRPVAIRFITPGEKQVTIQNQQILAHSFLKNMQEDPYFPAAQVEKGKEILRKLCEAIEAEKPSSLEQLYALTHAATEEFNLLGEEFEENGSELETAARENIGADFEFVAKAYGFEADAEELIATREW